MENTTKAMLIAAGMFFAILLVSALTVFYNNISAYYTQKQDAEGIEQVQKFNANFENYHRNNIRGSDLISLMNKVIDYNATESYFAGTGYKRIKVTITLGGNSILNKFKYETINATSTNQYLNKTKINGNWVITNTTGTGVSWEDDKNLIAITNTPSDLSCLVVGGRTINISDTQLQQLTTGIGDIITDENEDYAAYNRLKRAEIIKDVLGISYDMNQVTGRSHPIIIQAYIKPIKDAVSQYYQYMQFKRACFDCTEIKYDPETNRVEEMKFKLQIQNGNVVFN